MTIDFLGKKTSNMILRNLRYLPPPWGGELPSDPVVPPTGSVAQVASVLMKRVWSKASAIKSSRGRLLNPPVGCVLLSKAELNNSQCLIKCSRLFIPVAFKVTK